MVHGLTPNQFAILREMAQGNKPMYSRISHRFYFAHHGAPRIDGRSFLPMEKRGWIKVPAFKLGQFFVECELTDAGRAALLEAKGEK